jgi:hypothetical protein
MILRNLLATLAFAAVVAGLWLERPSLALILPGLFVFGCLALDHLTGKRDAS